jgi:hypothetical protein
MPEPAANPWPQRGLLLFVFFAALAVPTAYTLYTNHIWEDFFITFRHSQNLCEGKGLVYNEGERVHGFTSPLGVLLPALCYLATGSESYVPALWLFRAVCIAAFAGGAVLVVLAIPREQPFSLAIRAVLGLLYVLEAKSVAYTTNGMETAFMLLFLAWSLYLFARGSGKNWLATGVCWAALMWTRPDSCVYIAALALGRLLFTAAPRRSVFGRLLLSGVVCTALYLPWFIGAWQYYGSPVPHTVQAKSGLDDDEGKPIGERFQKAWNRFPEEAAAGMFRPIYYNMGTTGWYRGLEPITLVLGLFSAFYWLVPINDRVGRMASFCFFALCVYFAGFVLHIYPWYMPPVTLFGLVALASGLVNLAGAVAFWKPAWRVLAVIVLLALVFERGWLTSLLTREMKVQEELVEMGNRKRVGDWLSEHVRPGERVYLEPVGYIGYFSHAKILDWPGLVSPEVVRLRKENEKKRWRYEFEGELRPEWIVLRPGEASSMEETSRGLERDYFKDYEKAEEFDVRDRLKEYEPTPQNPGVPGYGYLWFDSKFIVYRRKDLAPKEGT